MNRFKTKNNYLITKDILVLMLIITTLVLYIFLSFNYTKYLKSILSLKIEEGFKKTVKKEIKLNNYDLNEIIKIRYDNNKISYIETNNNVLNDINCLIQDKIDSKSLSNDFYLYKDVIYYKMPILVNNNTLLNNIGPMIPVRVEYFKNIISYIKTDIKNYGINNSIIKVYLEIYLDQSLYFPFVKKNKRSTIRIELGTKIIPGNIPYFYGDNK